MFDAKAIVIAGKRCVALDGPCETVCNLISQTGPDTVAQGRDYVFDSAEARSYFRETAARIPGMSGDTLLSICQTYDALRPFSEPSRN